MEFRTNINEITTFINNSFLGILESNMQTLTPNQLVLGRNFNPIAPGINVNSDTSLIGLKIYAQDVYKSYWFRWEVEVLLKLFVPGPKWNKSRSNAKVNYIGLLLFHRVSAGKFFDCLKIY